LFGALLPTMNFIRGFYAPAVLATLLEDPCVGLGLGLGFRGLGESAVRAFALPPAGK